MAPPSMSSHRSGPWIYQIKSNWQAKQKNGAQGRSWLVHIIENSQQNESLWDSLPLFFCCVGQFSDIFGVWAEEDWAT